MFVTEGKSHDTVKQFSKGLNNHGGKTENTNQVSCDMSRAFIKETNKNLLNVKITFDKFHVIKVLNNAVDTVRKHEMKEQPSLKKMKYVFLKNKGSLTETQKKKLTKLFCTKLNLKTVRAMHIRENFQQIYEAENKKEVANAVKQWYFWALTRT